MFVETATRFFLLVKYQNRLAVGLFLLLSINFSVDHTGGGKGFTYETTLDVKGQAGKANRCRS
jgi:hypothetical protein